MEEGRGMEERGEGGGGRKGRGGGGGGRAMGEREAAREVSKRQVEAAEAGMERRLVLAVEEAKASMRLEIQALLSNDP